MKRWLETILNTLQFLGSLLTELIEGRFLKTINQGAKYSGKAILQGLESLHQSSWWAKVLISLLGLGSLAWICF